MEKTVTFYNEYEDMFEEYLEDVIGNLKLKNTEYKNLQRKFDKILDQNRNLNLILEGQIQNRQLSTKECKKLAELIQIYFDMQNIEQKEIFFSGSRELYSYFRRLEILK